MDTRLNTHCTVCGVDLFRENASQEFVHVTGRTEHTPAPFENSTNFAAINPRLLVKEVSKPHWPNPWTEAVPVPIELLAECTAGLGETWSDTDGSRFTMTTERVLTHWRRAGEHLDAYILPENSGWHSIGVRYGAEGSAYLSPQADKNKTEALLRLYR